MGLKSGLDSRLIAARIHKGWSVERAINTPAPRPKESTLMKSAGLSAGLLF